MLGEIEKKRIGRLYDLLQKIEKEDFDTVAALRWAIFTLEQGDWQDTGTDIFFRLAFMPEQSINNIMNSGAFNEIVKGYLVAAMQDMGFERTSIIKTAITLDGIFEEMDAKAARKVYREL